MITKLLTEQDRIYPVPCVIRSRISLPYTILFLLGFAALFSLVGILLLFPTPRSDDDWLIFLLSPIVAGMAFYFLATWIHSGLLKKGFVSIDEETISVCMLLGTKKAFWKDLDGISVAEVRGVRFLRLTRSHGRREKQLISIPFSLFAGTDFDRLTETAAYMMERNAKQIETSGPPVGQSENPLDNSSYGVCEKNGTRRNGVALLRALLLSCILLAVDTFIAVIFALSSGGSKND